MRAAIAEPITHSDGSDLRQPASSSQLFSPAGSGFELLLDDEVEEGVDHRLPCCSAICPIDLNCISLVLLSTGSLTHM